jgi:hypothetical protein
MKSLYCLLAFAVIGLCSLIAPKTAEAGGGGVIVLGGGGHFVPRSNVVVLGNGGFRSAPVQVNVNNRRGFFGQRSQRIIFR